jgi:DNA-binding transcriptional LysR family regulator
MQWDDLRVFLAVHRLGSHKGAARQLRIDPTTVGRRITALEAALGAQLFLRTPERLQTTPAGHKLAARAERIEVEALDAERELLAADTRLEGSLRITATDGFAYYVLLPALAEFRREHPLVSVEIRIDARTLDLSRREADVAVRLFRPKEPALIARRLGEMRFSLFASHDYVRLRGTPRNLAALEPHDFVGLDPNLDHLPETQWLRKALPEPRYVVRATTTSSQTLACVEGHGIALLPTFVAAREPRLVRLFPRLAGPVRELWTVIHSDLRMNARTTAFVSWLTRWVGGLPDSRPPITRA